MKIYNDEQIGKRTHVEIVSSNGERGEIIADVTFIDIDGDDVRPSAEGPVHKSYKWYEVEKITCACEAPELGVNIGDDVTGMVDDELKARISDFFNIGISR